VTARGLARHAVPAALATAAVAVLLHAVRPRPPALPAAQRPPPLEAGPSTKVIRGASSRRPRRPGRVRSGLSEPFTTPFSFMQVRVTFTGRELTRVETVELSGVGARTQAINARAEPILRAEALRADGRSDIDAVTGATYTSQSYRKALQSAIDRARGG
jgi:FMN-binding domain